MKQKREFLLDANTFIEAKNRHYAFDICPGYWTALLRLYRLGFVYSIDRVRAELVGRGDELSDWISQIPSYFFRQIKDQAVAKKYAEIVRWVETRAQYTEEARERFLSGADPWLVAYAAVNNVAVVTYEVHRPDAKNTVPIPNVCIGFSVDFVDPFQMLRELGVRFRSSRVKPT